MFTSLQKTAITAATSLFTLTSWAYADAPQVSEIDVDTTFMSVEGSNVMAYYPDIAEDLKARIMERIAPTDDPNAAKLSVDLREVSLDGSAILPDSKVFNKLEGVVSYVDEDEQMTTPIKISAEAGDIAPMEGVVVIQPNETDFYIIMVDAFAQAVVDTLPE